MAAPKMIRSTTTLDMASLWRKNRRRASCHWDRASICSPCSYTVPSCVGSAGPCAAGAGVASFTETASDSAMGFTFASVCSPGRRGVASVITDPWVEPAVDDVCNQVEEDDDDRCHHQPSHQRVNVTIAERA